MKKKQLRKYIKELQSKSAKMCPSVRGYESGAKNERDVIVSKLCKILRISNV